MSDTKKMNMEKVTQRYNDLMYFLGLEHLTIGERLSENTDGWNLRDMVSEAQYQLDCYFEEGHCFADMRHDDDPRVRRQFWIEVQRLRRFINRFGPMVEDMTCTEGHCSKWDNG